MNPYLQIHYLIESLLKNQLLVLITILCSVLLPDRVIAQEVDQHTAEIVAVNFYLMSNDIQQNNGEETINADLVYTSTNDNIKLYYVFNIGKDNGFVIVSALEDAVPILGYSDKGAFNLDYYNQYSTSFSHWMRKYEEQLIYVSENNNRNKNKVNEYWEILRYYLPNRSNNTVTKLPLDTKWSQLGYYNENCPIIEPPHPNTYFWDHTPTGCMATSLAQTLKYYNYPITGIGNKTYQDPPNLFRCNDYDPSYGEQSAPFGITTYQWNLMPNSCDGTNYSQVAELMYHCGVSLQMDYAYCSSTALDIYLATALLEYFAYQSTAQLRIKTPLITWDNWESNIINEIDNGRLVIYNGNNDDGDRHSFVCFGYQSTVQGFMFNFNFGDGYGDGGFYYLRGVTGDDLLEYHKQQSMVTGIQPPEFITVSDPSSESISITPGYCHGIKWYSNISSDVTIQLYKNDTYVLTIGSSVDNDGYFDWYVPCTLETGNDYQIKITSIANTSTYDYSNFSFTITDPDLPDPEWSVEPYAISSTAISMKQTDQSNPNLDYEFDFIGSSPNGSGGTDSEWISEYSYVDENLKPNNKYGYRTRLRINECGTSGYTETKYTWTQIETPAGIKFSSITSNSINLKCSNNFTNPDLDNSGLILYNAEDPTGVNSGWKQNNDYWNCSGLDPNTEYGFYAKARNAEGELTASCNTSYCYTAANTPLVPLGSNAYSSSVKLSIQEDGNPSNTVYAIKNNTNDNWVNEDGFSSANPVWRTKNQWDIVRVKNLNPESTYSFALKACNGDNLETAFSPSLIIQTAPPPNGEPALSGNSCNPASGTSELTYTFQISYSDPEGDEPESKEIIIDENSYTMSYVSGSYTTGAVFEYSTNELTVGNHSYYFQFSDGRTLKTSSTFSGPDIVDPDFTLQATPETQIVSLTNTTSFTISTSALASYSENIVLSVSDLPDAVGYNLNPTTISPGESATLTLSTEASCEPGNYTFTITGTSGSIQHQAEADLVVIEGTPISSIGNDTLFEENSPYLIQENLIIPQGNTLTIEPGVVLKFMGSYSLKVYGTLLAIGNTNDSIVFQAEDPVTGWKGLKFFDQSDHSVLNCCVIKYGKVNGKGGGIYATNSNIVISNSSISHNQTIGSDSDGHGGGIYISGGGPKILNSDIHHNNTETGYGCGVFIVESSAIISNCKIYNNYSEEGNRGGGLWISNDFKYSNIAPPEVYNTVIENNYCERNAGGLYLGNTDAIIVNCVIKGNSILENDPDDGGGGVYKRFGGNPVIKNCIIWGNSANDQGNQVLVKDDADTLYIQFTDIYNYSNTGELTGPVHLGNGIINEDPLFLSDNSLSLISPCIDKGDSSVIDAMIPPGLDSIISDMGAFGGKYNYGDNFKGLLIQPSNLDFRQLKINTSKTLSLNIYNYSHDTLDLQDITSNSPHFDLNFSASQIDPLSDAEIEVNFLPTSTQPYSDTLLIQIDSTDIYYLVTGEGVLSTTVYGEVYGLWQESDNPVLVVDDITLPFDKSLTIDSGVNVLFNGNYKFDVYGDLEVNGTMTDTVVFDTNNSVANWHGIRFFNCQDVNINYAKFTNAHKNDDFTGTYDNRRGGALYFEGATAYISNSKFENNKTEDCGGAIYASNSEISLNNSTFFNNKVEKFWSSSYNTCFGGGAIAIQNTTLSVDSCIIKYDSVKSNSDETYGGGISGIGNSEIKISNSTIYKNIALTSRSYGIGGGISVQDESRLLLSHCDVTRNIAQSTESGGNGRAGGINSEGYLFVNNCNISSNTAKANGNYSDADAGAIGMTKGFLYNTRLLNNSCYTQGYRSGSVGGAIYEYFDENNNRIYAYNCVLKGNTCTAEYSNGGGIFADTMDVINCVVYGNSASGSIESKGGGLQINYFGNVINSVVYDNNAGFGSQVCGRLTEGPDIDYSLVENYTGSGSYWGVSFGANMLDTNPLFINPSGNNFHLQSTGGGFPTNSPCIDYGHPNYTDACLGDSTGLGNATGDLGMFGGLYNCNQQTLPFLICNYSQIDFDSVYIQKDSSVSLQLENFGADSLVIDSITVSGADSAYFECNYSTPFVLLSDSAVYLNIKYAPLTQTADTGFLLIHSNSVFGMTNLRLTGHGVEAIMHFETDTIYFGNCLVDEKDTSYLGVSNSGNGNLIINQIELFDNRFSKENVIYSVIPGDTIQIPIYFLPDSMGEIADEIVLISNDDTSLISLRANGVSPLLQVESEMVNFGYVKAGEDSSNTLVIRNIGSYNLQVYDITSSSSIFSVSENQFEILPDSSKEIEIMFSPVGNLSYWEYIEIQSNSDTSIVFLSGSGYDNAFENVADQSVTGIDDYSMSSAWADFNLDGHQDLFVVNYNSLCRLFKNNGDGTFTDWTMISMINVSGPAYSCTWSDYDNDDDPDLYVTMMYQENKLFRNEGDGTFLDLSSFSGLNDNGPSKGSSWADYNNDGYLDLFVCNYGAANRFFENQGNGQFIDLTDSLGLGHTGYGQTGTWSDYDLDGDQDLYVTNWNNQANLFYLNVDGQSFQEVGDSLGVSGSEKSKSSVWGDFDNDGDEDIYLINWYGESNMLYRNDSIDGFTEVGNIAGVNDDGFGNGACWFDYDNDGFLDIFLVTFNNDENILYRNMGNGTFVNFSSYTGVNISPVAKSVSVSDYDNDGFSDCYISVANDTNILYHNLLDEFNWLKVKLNGITSNSYGVGSRIQTWAGGQIQNTRQVQGGQGYLSGNSYSQNMGTGNMELLDSLIVYWPGGAKQIISDQVTNQSLVITEETNTVPEYFLVSDTTISDSETACFNASDSLIIAGDGNVVNIEQDATADFISGNTIIIKPGFHAVSGSYVHASITEEDFCSSLNPTVSNALEEATSIDPYEESFTSGNLRVNIFPNPSDGEINLVFENELFKGHLHIYNINGRQLFMKQLNNEKEIKIDLDNFDNGLYILKLLNRNHCIIHKVLLYR